VAKTIKGPVAVDRLLRTDSWESSWPENEIKEKTSLYVGWLIYKKRLFEVVKMSNGNEES